ncbi:Protein-tyrosine phosphatase-related protein [hydrothermal vent metagenome]|uniref:Protein-tyrosine phosphatase-related protein n=1 Tax=hydrothermal vent metagenome TaxID=652676 RepID=A0A3B0XZY6_9ZZZZ
MKALLITQCLQNDFVKPLASGEALPNQLHIGHDESKRLIGDNIHSGPLGRFISWSTSQAADQLSTLHIRDWHDASCPDQASHLKQFNTHCIQNSSGAEFIFNSLLNKENSHDRIINSTTLNDFEGTGLKALLDTLTSSSSEKNKLRVGIIGVWTEAKVLFIAYELATRYPHLEISVCSALTASSSRSQHFLALQQLQRIIGINIIDSIGEFIQFLGGAKTNLRHKNLNKSLIISIDEKIQLNDETEYLIRYLFRDCQKILLKILDGGFSGNLVAGVSSIDIHGHEQAPHVIKIGPRDLMAIERTSFEQIETVLGNNAPAIAEYADAQHSGAIKYRYASMDAGNARSLQQCFQNNEKIEKIYTYLEAACSNQLGRLYRAAVNETHDLMAYYGFDSAWADSVKNKIINLTGHCPEKGKLQLPGNIQTYNLYHFYKNELDTLPPLVADYPFAFVHGDLNGANIIIDNCSNVWIIDFFHTHRGHILKDFSKLENDLLYIYTPINTEDELKLAFKFTDFLLSLKNPLIVDKKLPDIFNNSPFQRTYSALKKIRSLAKQNISDDSPALNMQWLIPQLRYSVHTIGFDEPTELQRIWALYTASRISEIISKHCH